MVVGDLAQEILYHASALPHSKDAVTAQQYLLSFPSLSKRHAAKYSSKLNSHYRNLAGLPS